LLRASGSLTVQLLQRVHQRLAGKRSQSLKASGKASASSKKAIDAGRNVNGIGWRTLRQLKEGNDRACRANICPEIDQADIVDEVFITALRK
jgi:hypothetical protein